MTDKLTIKDSSLEDSERKVNDSEARKYRNNLVIKSYIRDDKDNEFDQVWIKKHSSAKSREILKELNPNHFEPKSAPHPLETEDRLFENNCHISPLFRVTPEK